MNMRTPASRVDEEVVNEGVPARVGQSPQSVQVHQGNEVPIVGQGDDVLVVPLDMTNRDIREAIINIMRARMTKQNRGIAPRVNSPKSTITSTLRDFVRVNHPIFLFLRF